MCEYEYLSFYYFRSWDWLQLTSSSLCSSRIPLTPPSHVSSIWSHPMGHFSIPCLAWTCNNKTQSSTLVHVPPGNDPEINGVKKGCIYVLVNACVFVDVKFIWGLPRIKFHINKNKGVLTNFYHVCIRACNIEPCCDRCDRPHIIVKYWPLIGQK